MTKPSATGVWPTSSGRRLGPAARVRTVLIAGYTAVVLAACATGDRVEYIPSDRGVVPLQAGEPAPAEGWFVPPAVMLEIVPCLDERFQQGALSPSTSARTETDGLGETGEPSGPPLRLGPGTLGPEADDVSTAPEQ